MAMTLPSQLDIPSMPKVGNDVYSGIQSTGHLDKLFPHLRHMLAESTLFILYACRPNDCVKVYEPNLDWKLDFRGHLSTFQAENAPKSKPFKIKKQMVKNFLKKDYIP